MPRRRSSAPTPTFRSLTNNLVKLAIRWRLQARNGQSYEEEYAEYEKECRKRFGSSLAAKDINLAVGGFGEKFDAGVIIHGKSDN